MASKTTDSIDNICAVCSEVIEIYAIGSCDHHICFKCSTRMRVLCEQTYCSICRTELPKVIFVKKLHRYAYIETHHFLVNRRYKIYFENDQVQTSFYKLLEHSCRECPNSPVMRTFAQLKDHMRKEHSLYFCDICVKHLKIFVHERKYYSRADLATHRRTGDKDDRSHKGHPLCEFCDDRFLDNDELLRHLRKEHYYCHFCDADGSNQYYSDYHLLKEHFKEKHYLCEEGDCQTAQFTNVFRTQIDLKAHIATEHGKNAKRSQIRQARTLDIEINLAPRGARDMRQEGSRGVNTAEDYEKINRDGRSRGSRGRGRGAGTRNREEMKMAKVITASLAEVERQTGSVNVVAPELIKPLGQSKASIPAEKFHQNTEDFPDLDGKTVLPEQQDESVKESKAQSTRSLAKKLALSSNLSVQDGNMASEEFPALGGATRTGHSSSHRGFWNKNSSSHQAGSSHSNSGGVVQVVGNTPPTSSSTNSNSLHDFPALASSVNAFSDVKPKIPGLHFAPAKKSPVHSPQSARKVNPTEQKTVKQVTDHQRTVKEVSSQDEYPVLGKPSKPVTTVVSNKKVIQPKPIITKPVIETKNASSLEIISQSLTVTCTSNKQKSSLVEKEFPQIENSQRNGAVESSKGKNKKNKNSGKKTSNSNVVVTESSSDSNNCSRDVAATSDNNLIKPEISSKVFYTSADLDKLSKLTISDFDSLSNPNQVSKPSNKSSKKQLNDDDFSSLSKTKPPGITHPLQLQKNVIKEEDFPTLGGAKDPVCSQTNGWVGKPRHSQSAKSVDTDEEFVKMKSKGKKKKKAKKSETEEEQLKKFAHDNPFNFTLKNKTAKEEISSEDNDESEKGEKVVRANKKKKSNKKITPAKEEEFPSLSSATKENLDVKLNELDVNKEFHIFTEALKDSSNISDILFGKQNGFNLEDEFPAFVKETAPPPPPPPPPGFPGAQKNPPPGFTSLPEKKQDIIASAAPPGFSSLSGQKVSSSEIGSVLTKSKNTSVESNQAIYLKPPCFQQRNAQLIDHIQQLIGQHQDKFGKFRLWSGQFRKGQVSAEEYYKQCAELMGKTSFLTIFPELLVLLPDIEKQQQLLAVYNKQPKSVEQRTKKKSDVFKIAEDGAAWNTKGSEQFPVCSVCMQVLTPNDYRPHYVEHNIEEDYPSLSSTVTQRNQFGMSAWVKT